MEVAQKDLLRRSKGNTKMLFKMASSKKKACPLKEHTSSKGRHCMIDSGASLQKMAYFLSNAGGEEDNEEN